MSVLAPTMTARVIQQLQAGPADHAALLARIADGNPSTLSYRLRMMREAGLIEADAHDRPTWQLTAAGRAAVPVLRAVDQWARHRTNPGRDMTAVVRVERAMKVLSKVHTTHVIIGLADGPLLVKELLVAMPAGIRENNLRDRLRFLAAEEVLAQDNSGELIRYHLTLDGLRTAKIHHRAAAFAQWRAEAEASTQARSRANVPTLKFSHQDPRGQVAA
ncbi:winged helix-turn-helix transcriptional regulator [Streptacidiphilus jiangxiensis]|nr:winged helix-turn-helix transcriptional regulator [Streptacidiphilus jiangxiensis]